MKSLIYETIVLVISTCCLAALMNVSIWSATGIVFCIGAAFRSLEIIFFRILQEMIKSTPELENMDEKDAKNDK